jgi:hypothetical protein
MERKHLKQAPGVSGIRGPGVELERKASGRDCLSTENRAKQ